MKVEIARIEAEARVLAAKATAEAGTQQVQSRAVGVEAASDSGAALQGVMHLFTTMLANQSKQLAELTRLSESRKRGREDEREE
jgi:hypothetical protein